MDPFHRTVSQRQPVSGSRAVGTGLSPGLQHVPATGSVIAQFDAGDAGSLVDRRPLGRLQRLSLVLCFLTGSLDGFDGQSIGLVAPSIAQHFGLPVASFAPVFAFGLFGMAVGALVLGRVSDRIGRRTAIMLALVVMAVFSLASAAAQTRGQLIAVRFLISIGLGGAIPVIATYVAEIAPARIRGIAICLLAASIPFGAMLAGLVTGAVMPLYGWRAIFVIGGLVPLANLLAIIVLLPESLRFLEGHRDKADAAKAMQRRLWPQAPVEQGTTAGRPALQSLPLTALFAAGRLRNTLVLATAFFMNVWLVYFIISWFPTLLLSAGLAAQIGPRAIAGFSFGGLLGTLGQGPLMARFGHRGPIVTEFAVFAMLVTGLAILPVEATLVEALAFAMGWMCQGAQGGLNVAAAAAFPTSIRATGMGFVSACGRIGAIVGAIVGGALIALNLQVHFIFLLMAVPAALAAAALTMLRPGRILSTEPNDA